MGKDRFSIELDRPTDSYFPGNVVNGYLKVELNSSMNVKEIEASFAGDGYVEVTLGTGKYAIKYTTREKYFKEKQILLNKGNTELKKGEHRYPFSFRLPMDIPSSFESQKAYIRYHLFIIIERSILRIDKVVQRIINVINPLNLNEITTENLMLASGSDGSEMVCCLCCESGPVSAYFKTDRKGYVPGDSININGEVTNLSKRPIKEVKIKLKMHVTLRAGIASAEYRNKLVSVKQGRIDPGDTANITNQKLLIPSVISSGKHGNNNIIEVSYVVELDVVPDGLTFDLMIECPIIIGGIPLSEVASRYGVTLPSAPALSSEPTELYNDQSFTPPPQASFAESVFGDLQTTQTRKPDDEKDEEVESTRFVPKYLYYKWNNENPVDLFTVKEG